MRGEGTAREKTKKAKNLLTFYSDRYPALARVCAEQMFKKQTLHTFSLRDSRNLQHRLCSFIEARENTRIQVFFWGGGRVCFLSTCSLYHADTAKRYNCFWNPSYFLPIYCCRPVKWQKTVFFLLKQTLTLKEMS